MKVLHIISGGDSGGAKTHVFSLLGELKNRIDVKIVRTWNTPSGE